MLSLIVYLNSICPVLIKIVLPGCVSPFWLLVRTKFVFNGYCQYVYSHIYRHDTIFTHTHAQYSEVLKVHVCVCIFFQEHSI